MASSLETLCGQAFGAKQYHLLGIYLQRAILILAVAAVPIGVIWLNMWRILVAMGQDPVVVEAAQSYTFWLLPVMFVYVVYFPLVKFFQTQGAVVQLMAISLVTVLFHVPLSWLLIDKLNVGLNGAAMVYTVSGVVNVSLMFGVVRFTPRFEKTFRSLSWDAFHGFGEFFGLAVPSATMFWYVRSFAMIAYPKFRSGNSVSKKFHFFKFFFGRKRFIAKKTTVHYWPHNN